MFAYNPTPDRSGEIIASGITGAADVNAKSMETMGNNISSALMSIGNVYGEHEGNKAKGRAFKDVFKVIAPSTGIDMKQLEALTGGSLKSDIDWYNARETISPLLPSLINQQLVGQKSQDAVGRMYTQETLRRERDELNSLTTPSPITVPTGMRRFN